MFARLAAAQENYQCAATLFRLAQGVTRHIRYEMVGPVRSLVDAALGTVRTTLDPKVFAEAFATGLQLSLGEAFATVLHPTAIAA